MTRVLAEMTEAEALAAILPILPRGTRTLLGPGDDAAVLAFGDARAVISTDTMIEGPDFRRDWATPFDLGWKIVAVNLADIAAMGATPTGAVLALAAPGDMPLDDVVELSRGIAAAIADLAPGFGIIGGDLATSPTLTLAMTVFGELDGRAPVQRSGARAGDIVAHAGRRGTSARGLARLFAEADSGNPAADRAAAAQLRTDVNVFAHLRPEPPIEAGRAAAEAGATAMLDVSDGLAQDAQRLARASGVGIDFSESVRDEWELHGGEDHGLLATFPPDAAIPNAFSVVGIATPESGVIRWRGDVIHPRRWEALAGERQGD
ncbi:MAG TPA: thiamine-phosphate kinase [Microbacteriaceae bacterium]|nr:thiamine-phosphate kinase [Microbacteriaceae bacterium]